MFREYCRTKRSRAIVKAPQTLQVMISPATSRTRARTGSPDCHRGASVIGPLLPDLSITELVLISMRDFPPRRGHH
jgi:hypothetical protein